MDEREKNIFLERKPLHEAFHSLEDDEIVRDIAFFDNFGLSHFHIVSIKNDISAVEDFLKSGVPVDSSPTSGRFAGYTALHFAVLYNQKDVVEMLLKWNAQVNIKTSKEQLTSLHMACNYFNMKFLNRVPTKGNFDWTSKHNIQLEIIKLLLLYGANVSARDSLGRTPLLSTCMGREHSCSSFFIWDFYQINTQLKEIIQILLSNEADINACTDSKKSIMHIISENNCLKNSESLLEFCMKKGADIYTADVDGFTPLHRAVQTTNKVCIEFFLKHKANVNAKSKDLKIPLNFLLENLLRYSLREKNKEILLLLLEYGSDVNLRYKNDRVLWLHALEKCNNLYLIENLLNYGANINVEDSKGNPLMVSILRKWPNQILHNWVNKMYAFHIIFMHLQKLLAAGFYVNDSVRNTCYKLRQQYRSRINDNNDRDFANIFQFCDAELARMKRIKIDSYASLHSVLFEDTHELSKHFKNSIFIKIFDDGYIDRNFPLYSCLFKAKFKKARLRSELLEFANVSLFCVTGLLLSDLCYDLILKHLTNEEIFNLNRAASEIAMYKEKTDNNFSKVEPQTKVQEKQ